MFSLLGESFTNIFYKIKQKGSISSQDLDTALRSIRISMLEADVALSVTKEFIKNIKNKAIGRKIVDSVTPGQMIIKIVHDELQRQERVLNRVMRTNGFKITNVEKSDDVRLISGKCVLHTKNEWVQNQNEEWVGTQTTAMQNGNDIYDREQRLLECLNDFVNDINQSIKEMQNNIQKLIKSL